MNMHSHQNDRSTPLAPIVLPDSCNYVALFLTLDCNLHCSYCINRFGELSRGRGQLTGEEWLAGINRLVSRADLPVTLQGGEPTLHPDFLQIVNGIRPDLHLDLLTNLEFDTARFMEAVAPERFRRDAPYASIRVSYHPESMDIETLAARVRSLLDRGYSVGIWGVLHPRWTAEIESARQYCLARGIDFRVKEFLGEADGVMHGQLSYPDACDRGEKRSVRCRTTELIVGPGGDLYRCHADLYEGRASIGHLLDPALCLEAGFRGCDCYGHCNPCDVKLKTNRFQVYGHTSVEIVRDE
jgi:hypothetical protein